MASEIKPDVENQFTKQPYIEDVGPRNKRIQFSMFSGAEIRKAAELQVWSSGFYGPNREPKPNALLDPRMVAKSMKIVLTSRQASIIVTLDIERIQCSQLRISTYSVQQSILHHPRTKLKLQHVEVLDDRKLRIHPPVGDRSKLHFELHSLKSVLPKVIVKGIPTVERAVINKDKGKYNLLVEGTNLRAVMGTPGVDGCKTTSNHIIEVQETLGIEAARKCIIDEIQYTMASHGMSIDIRHMMLLADLMTSKGEVLGITRFGIQKMKESVLMLASFEKTADHLFNASVNGRDDKIEGVSECIIMGIPMQIGTGILKVRQRLEQIPKLNYGLDPIIS